MASVMAGKAGAPSGPSSPHAVAARRCQKTAYSTLPRNKRNFAINRSHCRWNGGSFERR